MKVKMGVLLASHSTLVKKKVYEFEVPEGINKTHTRDNPLWWRADGCWHNAFYDDGKLYVQMLHSYHTFEEVRE